LEVAKSSWEGLRDSETFKSVLGLEDGFDVVLECTGVESCMQMAVMVSPLFSFYLSPCSPSHLYLLALHQSDCLTTRPHHQAQKSYS
jgi:hypothetical protein